MSDIIVVDLKVGDVVTLKGQWWPALTVIDPNVFFGAVTVAWFNNQGEPQQATYPIDAVQKPDTGVK